MAQQHCKKFQAIDKWKFSGTHKNAGVHYVHFLIGHLYLIGV
jgi:hypothetical protein